VVKPYRQVMGTQQLRGPGQHRGPVGRSDRSVPHWAQHCGSQRIVSSGSLPSPIVAPGAPGCLPGLRPEAFRAERLAGLR
jgi:hypothetical protein